MIEMSLFNILMTILVLMMAISGVHMTRESIKPNETIRPVIIFAVIGLATMGLLMYQTIAMRDAFQNSVEQYQNRQ